MFPWSLTRYKTLILSTQVKALQLSKTFYYFHFSLCLVKICDKVVSTCGYDNKYFWRLRKNNTENYLLLLDYSLPYMYVYIISLLIYVYIYTLFLIVISSTCWLLMALLWRHHVIFIVNFSSFRSISFFSPLFLFFLTNGVE